MSGGVSYGHNLQNSMPYMDNLTLVSSAARTASDTTTVKGLAPYTSAYFMLDVTAAATEAGDILAVFIQREMPNGDWMDIVSFAQVLGNGGAKKYRADVYPGATGGETSGTINDGALTAGSVADLAWGDALRVKWTVTDASTDNASFTFSVTGTFRV